MATRRKSPARSSAPKKITDDDVKAAVDVISSEYWQDVRESAADFVKQFENGDFSDQDAFMESLNQYVDGSQRVIYTYWAQLGLLATNSAGAYEEEMGEETSSISLQMYFAYRQDILNAIGSDIDFDS